MEDKIIVAERAALQTAGNRAAIEASAAWHLSELVRHLENAAQAKGCNVDLPDPLFFADLLRILGNLEVEPTEFFRGVIQRWRPIRAAKDEMTAAQRAIRRSRDPRP